MKMALHILLKDLRRMRAEIPLYMLTCATWAFTKTHPIASEWLHDRLQYIPVVLFGLWGLITIRMVQGESLVGDREFWITRPYRWSYLMAEKFFALIVCLNVPLLVAQVYILHAAGIPMAWAQIPGLIFLSGAFALLITFPIAVFAAVTESIVQFLTAAAEILVFVFVMTWLPWSKLPASLSGTENEASVIGFAMIVPALAFVLVWQYARRRTWLARIVVGAAVLSVPIVVVFASTPIARSLAYPRVHSSAPFNIWIENRGADGGRTYTRSDSIYQTAVNIPIGLNTTDANSLVEIDGWRAVLTGDNGFQWESKWVNHSTRFNMNSDEDLAIDLPEGVANQLANAHATARVEIAFNVYQLGPLRHIDTSTDPFTIPGVGNCAWHSRFQFRTTDCTAALRLPEIVLVEMESGDSTCRSKVKDSMVPAGHSAISEDYGGTSLPAEFNIDPVRPFNLMFGRWTPRLPGVKDDDQPATPYFCQGTPLTGRTGTEVESSRASFNLGPIGVEVRQKPSIEDFEFGPKK